MLLIQEKLRSGSTLENLAKEHGLNLSYHKTLPLVTINYDQIESRKDDKLACECRGLILELYTWNLVANSFDRFFNLGEMLQEQNNFNWSCYYTNEKIDGSLMLLWHYDGEWRVSTRGSFADQAPNGTTQTWEEMFWQAFGDRSKLKYMKEDTTYVFEFVSPYTKIVRCYNKIDIYLLTVIGDVEFPPTAVDIIAEKLGLNRPKSYSFNSPKELLDWLDKNSEADPTFEGFVLRDSSGMRIKVKSAKYVSLHRLRGNGNIFSYKNLMPFVFDGEESELFVYFPEAKPVFDKLKYQVDSLITQAMAVWNSAKNEEYQKNFALSIKGRTQLGSVLFEARKLGVCPSTLFKNYQDLFLKIIKE